MSGRAFDILSEDIVQYLGVRVETYGEKFDRHLCSWLAHHSFLRRLLYFVIAC